MKKAQWKVMYSDLKKRQDVLIKGGLSESDARALVRRRNALILLARDTVRWVPLYYCVSSECGQEFSHVPDEGDACLIDAIS